MTGGTIVWLRQDLRLRDNPALHAATSLGAAVIPVYIWSPEEEGDWPPGAATRWWLHHSLASLADSLAERGSRLIIARGPALETLRTLAEKTSATAVYWNRRYEPAAIACSTQVKRGLVRAGLKAVSFNSALLMEPSEFLNQSGKPYQVYTAFMRALLHVLNPEPALPLPRTWRTPQHLSLIHI